ncbi:MAG: mechanosensitive ion channel family protein [Candidatus Saccharimonadales bacterium]
MELDFLTTWINEHALAILFIIALAILTRRFGMVPLEGFIRRAVKTSRFQTEAQHKQREQTLLDVSAGVFSLLVWMIAIAAIISQLEIDLRPLLAAGGLVGIVIAFGAQKVMQDIFAGLYVIVENQYQIGDVVDLDGDVGTVEDISLRMAVLRDLDGTVHHVPHGTVQRSKNLSKEYARVNLDIGVDYSSDIKKVIEVVNRVGVELAQDEDWQKRIITPPQFLRINDFADSAIVIKIIGETKPLAQWEVAGELRKRLKFAFDEAGIVIPFPQSVVHEAEGTEAHISKLKK